MGGRRTCRGSVVTCSIKKRVDKRGGHVAGKGHNWADFEELTAAGEHVGGEAAPAGGAGAKAEGDGRVEGVERDAVGWKEKEG